MREIKNYEIKADQLLMITRKNGSRIAGRARSAMREGRGCSWYVTIRPTEGGGQRRVDGDDVATILAA